jgi:YegS/Rv2252/BmrU family lipid kinase
MHRLAFFINPTIRNFKKIEIDIQHHFLAFNYKFFISEYSGHFMSLPKMAVDEGFTHFIAVGGDGTLNEVVNGIINAFKTEKGFDWDKIKNIKIGILPSGSGNDFVKNLGYKTIDELQNLITKDTSELVDVGFTEYLDRGMNKAERFFINVSDVGIGGEVVINKEKLPMAFPGELNYFMAIVSTFLTYKKKKIKVTAKEFTWEGKVLNFVVANAKYFGNSIGIAPHAEISDGKFAITNIGDISLKDYFMNIGTAKKCKKIMHPEVSYTESEELLIENTSQMPLTIDMDGEFIGYAPVQFACLKQKLNFLK